MNKARKTIIALTGTGQQAGGKGNLALAALLAVLAFLPYAQTWDHLYVNYDDTVFVTGNDRVREGLTVEGVRWAVTAYHAGNWMPLTWLSHMADVSLFGLEPGPHHLVNAVLHALSTALLFVALHRMTGAAGKSAFVAALFGVHPLHVESVAWVAERKDVLSGLFFMLTLLSYERYVRRGGASRYLLVLLCFSLGLLSKSMLVTVPAVLLLLDAWPLGRTSLAAPADGSAGRTAPWGRLLMEKAPLLLLSVLVSAVTLAAQREAGAMGMMEREVLPLADRAANALLSYVSYLAKAVWPLSLAILYPHPGAALPAGKVAASAAFLLAISVLVLWRLRQRPFLAIGWSWYLGMLVPVIGLVQVGMQGMADRYTYLPLIGIFVMAAWSSGDIVPRTGPVVTRAVQVLSGVVVLGCLALSFVQVSYWSDTVTLLRRATDVSPDNWMVRRMLGNELADRGLRDEAMEQYRESLRIEPRNPLAHNNLGVELAQAGRNDEAIGHYREAIRIRPDYAEARNNLGNALAVAGSRGEAAEQYREAMRLRPGWQVPQDNLRMLLDSRLSRGQGRPPVRGSAPSTGVR